MNERHAVAGMAIALAVSTVSAPNFAAGENSAKPAASSSTAGRHTINRGRYLLIVGSCNDCHTAGFAPSDGNVPEKDWLLGGGPLGFSGPWGTTYAPNLRLSMSKMSEADWVRYAKTLKTRPPMPWFNLNHWTEADLRAFYQYVRQLGPAGEPVPASYLPPGKKAPSPYIQWPMPPGKGETARPNPRTDAPGK